jgi:uncharacterized protein
MPTHFDFSKIEGFEWDEGNLKHIKKHKVQAEECEEIFFNKPLIINKDKEHSTKSERRFRVYGITNKERCLSLIYTIRNKKIRVIACRDQSRKERKEFSQVGGEDI